MKLTIPRSEAKEMVAGISKIIGPNTSLPILGGLRFFSNGAIIAEATDLDQTVRYTFNNATADEHGQFIVPLHAVKDMLSKGNGEDLIELETMSENKVNVTNRLGSQTVSQTITGLPADDWPTCQADVKTKPTDGFLERYRKACVFASSDSTRYVLNSVFVDVSGTGERPITLVATDGRRLSCWNSMALDIHMPTIIPVTKFLTWSGLTGDVAVGITTKREKAKGKLKGTERVTHFGLTAGNWNYVTRTVDGIYPNWKQVVPNAADCHNRISFTDEDTVTLVKVLSGLAGRNRKDPIIVLAPGENGNVIVTEQKPADETSTRLELSGGSKFEGETPIAVNAMYLCDAFTSGFRNFVYQDEFCPLLSQDNSGGKHVLMPMKLDPDHKPTTQHVTKEPTQPPVETVVENNKKEAEMPENKTESKDTPTSETSLDRVSTIIETAKTKVKDLGNTLSDLTAAIKDATKEFKIQGRDIESARDTLAKLKKISL